MTSGNSEKNRRIIGAKYHVYQTNRYNTFLSGRCRFSAAAQAASFTADQISIPEKPEFMASLGIAKDAKPNLSKEQKRDLAQQAYQEKADQHFMRDRKSVV